MHDRYDGQAGAAALTLSSDSGDDAFMNALYGNLKATGLPDYALPRLVRITKEFVLLYSSDCAIADRHIRIEANATFKKSKVDMAKKSWAPPSTKEQKPNADKLYWLDGKAYKPLDGDGWRGIESGKVKL